MASKLGPVVFGARDFVHLHVHTDYSLLQSTVQLKPLAKRLAELEQKACAITDYGNMYGAVSFFNTMAYAGVRPVIGYEAFLKFGDRRDSPQPLRQAKRVTTISSLSPRTSRATRILHSSPHEPLPRAFITNRGSTLRSLASTTRD